MVEYYNEYVVDYRVFIQRSDGFAKVHPVGKQSERKQLQ
jgi:hypothetical protein